MAVEVSGIDSPNRRGPLILVRVFFSVGYFILGHPICVNTKECEGEKSLGLFFYSLFNLDTYDFLIVNVCKDLEALSS